MSSVSMPQAARALVARDLRLLWRRRGDALQPALFALLGEGPRSTDALSASVAAPNARPWMAGPAHPEQR